MITIWCVANFMRNCLINVALMFSFLSCYESLLNEKFLLFWIFKFFHKWNYSIRRIFFSQVKNSSLWFVFFQQQHITHKQFLDFFFHKWNMSQYMKFALRQEWTLFCFCFFFHKWNYCIGVFIFFHKWKMVFL